MNDRSTPTGSRSRDDVPVRIESMHDVFSDPYRRGVLYYLTEVEQPAPLSDLAAGIAAWCPDSASVPADDEPIADWLLREHILGMAAFELVRFDADVDVVRLGEQVSVSVRRPWTDP